MQMVLPLQTTLLKLTMTQLHPKKKITKMIKAHQRLSQHPQKRHHQRRLRLKKHSQRRMMPKKVMLKLRKFLMVHQTLMLNQRGIKLSKVIPMIQPHKRQKKKGQTLKMLNRAMMRNPKMIKKTQNLRKKMNLRSRKKTTKIKKVKIKMTTRETLIVRMMMMMMVTVQKDIREEMSQEMDS